MTDREAPTLSFNFPLKQKKKLGLKLQMLGMLDRDKYTSLSTKICPVDIL